MAITFPLSTANFADLLMLTTVAFQPFRQDETSGDGTGEVISAELASPLWSADCTTMEMYNEDFRRVRALANSLRGPMNSFYLYDPAAQYPIDDPDGSILGAANPVIHTLGSNGKSLSLSSLPPGYSLSVGDYLAFDYGSPPMRAFHEIGEDSVANGSGITPEFELTSFLRTGVITGLSITLKKPSALGFIMPQTLKAQSMSATTSQLSFTFMQRLSST